jgi:hypothetical protein
MKIVTLTVLLGTALVAQAEDLYSLPRGSFVSLMVREPSLRLDVPYPGHASKNCGLKLRASRAYGEAQDWKPLTEALRITQRQSELTPTPVGESVAYVFRETGGFATEVLVRTRTGEPLEDVVRRTLPSDEPFGKPLPVNVIVETIDCPGR